MNDVTMSLVCDRYIKAALEEDITSEDVSTACVMPTPRQGTVDLVCKQDGVICGLDVFCRTFLLLDEGVSIELRCEDGDEVVAGQLAAVVVGDMRALLSAERVALNFLQRMSGIATYTRSMARLLEGSGVTLLDTRKTTPNCRVFEKYAVRVGGGANHRYNLSDGVLLKDNDIGAAGGVRQAVEAARAYVPFVRKVEVECESLNQVREAIDAGADIVMLDNMDAGQVRQAVSLIDGCALTECSGNVTLDNVSDYRDLGIDYVSCGALTHSAPALDVSMKHLRPLEEGEGTVASGPVREGGGLR